MLAQDHPRFRTTQVDIPKDQMKSASSCNLFPHFALVAVLATSPGCARGAQEPSLGPAQTSQEATACPEPPPLAPGETFRPYPPLPDDCEGPPRYANTPPREPVPEPEPDPDP